MEGGATGDSGRPTISAVRSLYRVYSTATDLVPDATNGVRQLYLFDAAAGSTTLVSASRFGPFGATDNSGLSLLSADGHTLVFGSTAADLAELDFNSANDLFTFSLSSTNAPTPFETTVNPGS